MQALVSRAAMPPRQPLVAVTSTSEIIRGTLRVRVNASYTLALEKAGAVPVIIPPIAGAARAAALLEMVDALVLTGGEDVDPSLYHAAPHPAVANTNPERDATELALVIGARLRRLPTLAICRGMQVVNVALGGTLLQDIPSERPSDVDHHPDSPRYARVHDVEIDPNSRLAQVIGGTRASVNSFHHQAVDRIATGLRVNARATDGIVEGLESVHDDWWMLGVQWHPEELTDTSEPWDRALFWSLVNQSNRRQSG